MEDEMDLEIEAMRKVSKALGGLDNEARGRVVRWAAERFGITLGATPRKQTGGGAGGNAGGGVGDRAVTAVSLVEVDDGGASAGVTHAVHQLTQVRTLAAARVLPVVRRSWK